MGMGGPLTPHHAEITPCRAVQTAERLQLKLALVLCERDHFQQFGPHAIRYFIDNVRPSLAESVIGGKLVRGPRVGGLVNHYARVA
jgi:hypothetical protein